jgi:biopolymer transport protein ExbD
MKRTSDSGSRIVLPITPLLDMTFQLLFFFLVTFHPGAPEGQMDLALPVEKGSAAPAPGEPVISADLTVKVRTILDGVNDGDISALAIRDSAGKETPVAGGLDGLKSILTVSKREKRIVEVQIEADGRLKVSRLLAVADVCKSAGFTKVRMISPDDLGR